VVKRALFALTAIALAWAVASWLPSDPPSDPPDGFDALGEPDSVAARLEFAASRVPVLLVPGWLDTSEDMDRLRSRLVEAGWPPNHVRAVSFDDPAGSNQAHAVELDVVARSVLRETGADSLDIVAFSMGGLATRWYLLRGEPVPVRRIAFLASPHRGTVAAHLAWGDGRDEMLPDSPFLDSLNAGPALPDGVEAITVRTQIDTHVLPAESATLPGVPDHEVCCPTHRGMLRDAQVFEIVRTFLADGG
jgi:triacylglycerol lipase